jgi:hypothetical protein
MHDEVTMSEVMEADRRWKDRGPCAEIYFSKDFSERQFEDTFRELMTTVGVGVLCEARARSRS